MPFNIHNVVLPSSISHETGVKVALSKRKDQPARLIVIVDQKTIEKFGWSWTTDLLQVLIGDREEFGLVRLVPSPNGTARIELKKAPKNDATYYRINLGVVESMPDEKQEPRWAQWRVVDNGRAGCVEITMPSWLRRPIALKVAVVDGTLDNGMRLTGVRSGEEHRVAGLGTSPAAGRAAAAPTPAHAAQVPPAVAAAANFQRPRHDRLPGDPPPGRSALEQKD